MPMDDWTCVEVRKGVGTVEAWRSVEVMSMDVGLSVGRGGGLLASTTQVAERRSWLSTRTTLVSRLRLGRSIPARSCMPASHGRGRASCPSTTPFDSRDLRRRHHQKAPPANSRGRTSPKTIPRASAVDFALAFAAAAAARAASSASTSDKVCESDWSPGQLVSLEPADGTVIDEMPHWPVLLGLDSVSFQNKAVGKIY